MSEKTLTAHRLRYYVCHFVASWGKSVQQREAACKFYADAINSGNLLAQIAFEALDGFDNLTPSQWKLMRRVGEGLIIPEYLDCPDVSVPLCMFKCHVSLEDQKDIWYNGLEVGTLTSRERNHSVRVLRAHHIAQVFIEATGEKRSLPEQVKFLRERVSPNPTISENKDMVFSHATTLPKARLAEFLPQIFTSAELIAIAHNMKRGARK